MTLKDFVSYDESVPCYTCNIPDNLFLLRSGSYIKILKVTINFKGIVSVSVLTGYRIDEPSVIVDWPECFSVAYLPVTMERVE